MADIAFLKLLLAHTEKDIGRVAEGPIRDTLRAQAERLRAQIPTPKKPTKKPRKKK